MPGVYDFEAGGYVNDGSFQGDYRYGRSVAELRDSAEGYFLGKGAVLCGVAVGGLAEASKAGFNIVENNSFDRTEAMKIGAWLLSAVVYAGYLHYIQRKLSHQADHLETLDNRGEI